MKDFLGCVLGWPVAALFLTAVCAGPVYLLIFFGMKGEHAVLLGVWVVLIGVPVSSWAVGKWRGKRRIKKEQLEAEKTEIITMIDEALEENKGEDIT